MRRFTTVRDVGGLAAGLTRAIDEGPLLGPRIYSAGPLGVIKDGADADVLLVDGNPLEDLSLLLDPEANLKLIISNGRIYKNTLIDPRDNLD